MIVGYRKTSCVNSHSRWRLYISWLHVTCRMSHVTCHMSHVTCQKSPAARHLSHVASFTTALSGRQLPVASLASPVSCRMSRVACLVSPVSCRQSRVTRLMSPVSCRQSHVACIMSLVLRPNPWSWLTKRQLKKVTPYLILINRRPLCFLLQVPLITQELWPRFISSIHQT